MWTQSNGAFDKTFLNNKNYTVGSDFYNIPDYYPDFPDIENSRIFPSFEEQSPRIQSN